MEYIWYVDSSETVSHLIPRFCMLHSAVYVPFLLVISCSFLMIVESLDSVVSFRADFCPYCWVSRQVLTGKLTSVLSPSHVNWEKSQTVEMDQVEKGWLTSMRSLVLIPGFPHSHRRRGAACKCVIQGWEAGDRRIMGIPGNQLQIEWDIYLPHLKWWITHKEILKSSPNPFYQHYFQI